MTKLKNIFPKIIANMKHGDRKIIKLVLSLNAQVKCFSEWKGEVWEKNLFSKVWESMFAQYTASTVSPRRWLMKKNRLLLLWSKSEKTQKNIREPDSHVSPVSTDRRPNT